jgi:hypothetical protein
VIDKPVSTDYLAISKALSAVFPKYTNTILWHEDARLQELDVSGYYGLQINRLINDAPVTLFLYQKPIDASYVLTDLGSLIFTNDIIEPLAKRRAFRNNMRYEDYDMFASNMVQTKRFQRLLASFNLSLTNSIDITHQFHGLEELPKALKSFNKLFDDLNTTAEVSVQA